MPLTVTIVVLAYNSEEYMAGCLDALARSRGVEMEIICVDNASRDDSHRIASEHPAVAEAIRVEENLGYSGGNNFGWRKGSAPYVVFINPDCRVMPGSIANLLRPLMEDDDVGATGAVLFYPNTHTVQHAGGVISANGLGDHIGVNQPDAPEFHIDRDCDYVTGALIGFRRADLERLGGFDEEYWPAYYEETDLCTRLRKEGKRIVCVGDAIGFHAESPGLQRDSPRFLRISFRSRTRFLIKNHTVGELLRNVIPAEAAFFFSGNAKRYRPALVRSYLSGAAFALRCMARLRRRGKPGNSERRT